MSEKTIENRTMLRALDLLEERKELILQYKGIIRGSSLPENTLMPILQVALDDIISAIRDVCDPEEE